MDSQVPQSKTQKIKIGMIIFIVLIGGFLFYWFSFKPQFDKRSCYKLAENEKQAALSTDNRVEMSGQTLIKRADYDKIFNDGYSNCLKSKGY